MTAPSPEPHSREGDLLWGVVSGMTVGEDGHASFPDVRGELAARLWGWRTEALMVEEHSGRSAEGEERDRLRAMIDVTAKELRRTGSELLAPMRLSGEPDPTFGAIGKDRVRIARQLEVILREAVAPIPPPPHEPAENPYWYDWLFSRGPR